MDLASVKEQKYIDWHNSKRKVAQAKIRIAKRFSKENTATASRFSDRLRLNNLSYGGIENYSSSVIRILHIKDDKKIEDWSRQEIEKVHLEIADSNYENSTKKSTLAALQRWYHFAVHDEIVVKQKGMECDSNVAWITSGSFRDKYDKIQPKDLLTNDEILVLIQTMKTISRDYVKRNIAIVFLMLEGAYRPAELPNIRIGWIEFHNDFVRIYTGGKEHSKRLTLVGSYGPPKEWLNEHPKSDDPDAFLLYQNNAMGALPYQTFRSLISTASLKSKIKKRVWPYLFRHTSLTEYSKRLGNIAKIYGNWSRNSNMLAHYEHLANSDQEDAVLRLHGIKKEG